MKQSNSIPPITSLTFVHETLAHILGLNQLKFTKCRIVGAVNQNVASSNSSMHSVAVRTTVVANSNSSSMHSVAVRTTLVYYLQLVLSEEDVWRSVIRWGENQAGCSGGYSQWTDDDRLNVKEVGGAANCSNSMIVIYL